ncbi:ABC transporter permease, partial [Okeania sp. SIO2B9]|nr:ABC transporter permease [Okeania sp. SIO2B9]
MLVVISNILAIYRKELQGYFASPLAYAITGIFWLLAGYFLVAILLGPDGIIQQIATRDQLGITEPPVDAPYEFLKAYLGIMGSLSLFLLPMLSMSLYAEERKRGTLELLATSPITNWAVATGKLLA